MFWWGFDMDFIEEVISCYGIILIWHMKIMINDFDKVVSLRGHRILL